MNTMTMISSVCMYSPLICTSYLLVWSMPARHVGTAIMAPPFPPAELRPMTAMKRSRLEYLKGIIVNIPFFGGPFRCYASFSTSLHFSRFQRLPASCRRVNAPSMYMQQSTYTAVQCTCSSSSINASSTFPAAGRWRAGRIKQGWERASAYAHLPPPSPLRRRPRRRRHSCMYARRRR